MAEYHSQVSLQYNQWQCVFACLSFEEILSLRLVSVTLNAFMIQYLRETYYPKHFASFNINEQTSLVVQLANRRKMFTITQVFAQENIEALMVRSNRGMPVDETTLQIIECYNTICPSLFTWIKETNRMEIDEDKYFAMINTISNHNNHDTDSIEERTMEELACQVKRINLPAVSMQMRAIAGIVRMLSQVVLNFQSTHKYREAKEKIRQYGVLSKIVVAAAVE